MAISQEAVAFAFLCGPEGTLAEVIYDEVGLNPGRDFFSVLDRSSRAKAKRFLKTAVASRAAFDWELKVLATDGSVPFFFSAAVAKGGVLIMGTKDRAGSKQIPKTASQGARRHPAALAPELKELASVRLAKARDRRRLRSGLSRINQGLEEKPDPTGPPKGAAARQVEQIRKLAHDLRNPISGILTASQYLIDDASPLLEPEHVTLLRSIESSSEFLLKLIRDMR